MLTRTAYLSRKLLKCLLESLECRVILLLASFAKTNVVCFKATARSAPDREKEINNLVSFISIFRLKKKLKDCIHFCSSFHISILSWSTAQPNKTKFCIDDTWDEEILTKYMKVISFRGPKRGKIM